MPSEPITLPNIVQLANDVLRANGCDVANADAVARNIVNAERDGSESHGLFRLPGYVASLRSGKVNGSASPTVRRTTPACVHVDGDHGYAPLALERTTPVLAEAALEMGIAVASITATYHFASLWHETEALADHNLAAIACVNSAAFVAPYGGKTPIFGTNPISFAWPRPGRLPVVVDMATAAMAQGEIQIAAREGRQVPSGTGLGPDGMPTNEPEEILAGVQLPFGSYKGSAIALLVELLAAGATGEWFSTVASSDSGDGGPSRGGEFIIALSPEKIAGTNWAQHCESFFDRFDAVSEARLPGVRRHKRREGDDTRMVDTALLQQIRDLLA